MVSSGELVVFGVVGSGGGGGGLTGKNLGRLPAPGEHRRLLAAESGIFVGTDFLDSAGAGNQLFVQDCPSRARTGQGERSNRIVLPSGRLRRLEEFFRRLKKSKPLKLFLRSVKIRRLVWHTEIGLRDSARLGLLGGALWALKGAVCAGLQQTVRLHRPPVLRVAPRFNSSYFRTVISCILEFPLGYAIIAAFICRLLGRKIQTFQKG